MARSRLPVAFAMGESVRLGFVKYIIPLRKSLFLAGAITSGYPAQMKYSVFTPRQIVFGWGTRSELGALASPLGRRALLVSGSRTLENSGAVDEILESLAHYGLSTLAFPVASREPEVRDVDELVAQFHGVDAADGDIVVAVGGGSTIDLAKAAAALVTQAESRSVVDYLEGVGQGLAITQPPLPMVAIPTTAGTGAEATKNSVISSDSTATSAFKKSLRSDQMIPRLVLVDPALAVSLPATTTAFTGMDAITQLIESYLSRRAAPIPQALCLQGLTLAIPALPLAVRDGQNRSAREHMAHAALLSGIALANSGLGMAHGVAAALGVQCQVPHGLACALLLPTALRVNAEVRQAELADLESLFQPGTRDARQAQAFVTRIETLCRAVGIPSRLRDVGVTWDQIPALVTGSRGNSMSGNPREIPDSELRALLEELW